VAIFTMRVQVLACLSMHADDKPTCLRMHADDMPTCPSMHADDEPTYLRMHVDDNECKTRRYVGYQNHGKEEWVRMRNIPMNFL